MMQVESSFSRNNLSANATTNLDISAPDFARTGSCALHSSRLSPKDLIILRQKSACPHQRSGKLNKKASQKQLTFLTGYLNQESEPKARRNQSGVQRDSVVQIQEWLKKWDLKNKCGEVSAAQKEPRVLSPQIPRSLLLTQPILYKKTKEEWQGKLHSNILPAQRFVNVFHQRYAQKVKNHRKSLSRDLNGAKSPEVPQNLGEPAQVQHKGPNQWQDRKEIPIQLHSMECLSPKQSSRRSSQGPAYLHSWGHMSRIGCQAHSSPNAARRSFNQKPLFLSSTSKFGTKHTNQKSSQRLNQVRVETKVIDPNWEVPDLKCVQIVHPAKRRESRGTEPISPLRLKFRNSSGGPPTVDEESELSLFRF